MSIVISGCIGLFNRGVEALVAPTVAELHRVLPEHQVVLLSGKPQYDSRRAFLSDSKVISDPFLGRMGSLTVRRLAARWTPRLVRREAVAHRAIKNSSLLIATGGDTFSSDYGDLRMHVEPLKVAHHYGVPFALLAHSIGPFTKEEERQPFVDIAKHAALITVRESRSFNYCIDDLKLDPARVVQTADPAFLLEPASDERVSQLQARYGIDPAGPTIALAVSQGISNFVGLNSSSQESAERHLETLSKLARYITQEMQAQLLLIPHVQDMRPHNNDLFLCDRLMDAVGDCSGMAVAWGDHTAAEFKGLIKASDAVIAERMHAAIAGLSTTTPTMVVRYSVKADGIIGDLLGGDAADRGAIIPFEDYLKHEDGMAIASLKKMWASREDLRKSLASKIDEVRAEAHKNYDLFAQLVNK
ncbi:polysaccharide pyruvyl transferase family protein [Aeoliella sp. ICT_H6.2]|uniref:Polysaccharide pyruvyl transferase family protein n=1 Tax=Aeoliella straminimaris TaxID=2954799 RepID=A0A9X2FBR0_9BACT|nr:polysaccharide pyruvyl transferase family protein [Aeoliella straminimaris]MCO6045248.1 polysaccharide pyruvyl transferase family protein [Aeoliella straminimaris]